MDTLEVIKTYYGQITCKQLADGESFKKQLAYAR